MIICRDSPECIILSSFRRKSMRNSTYISVCILVSMFILPQMVTAMEVYKNDDITLKAGFWGQAWYQTVSDGIDSNGDGRQDADIYDTMIRRAYFYAGADFRDIGGMFIHVAGDRIGQDNMQNRPSLGLGANLVVRDAWLTWNVWKKMVRLQVGRMYIPLTRNYGTTSTKSLLSLDLNWVQGGIRGGIFYPSKVGRDDGVCVWGNVIEDRLQYRIMVAEGIGDDAVNPSDNPRFAGRVSWAFMEPETAWFNAGTYLGEKKILTVGAGVDFQGDLNYDSPDKRYDYSAYTMDVHWDQPLGPPGAAITAEAAYIHVNNGPNSINYTHFTKGDDADIFSMKAGYLLPWKLFTLGVQPAFHYEYIDADNGSATSIFGGGINVFVYGQANKLSFDVTSVDQGEETYGSRPVQDHIICTVQLAVGF